MSGLSAFNIMKGLNTACIGRQVLYYPTLPSTMDAARIKAREGGLEGTVIVAGEQTSGRGRLNRTWISPEGNIALSIILHPATADLPYLIMMASMAAVRSIALVTNLSPQIKWPNDIVINGKKVCGILIENELKGNQVSFSIAGIGINTDLPVAEHPDIADTAASLQSETAEDLRLDLLQTLLTEFDKLYAAASSRKAIFRNWRAGLITLGKRVKATGNTQVIEGTAQDVDETGALMIHQDNGEVVKVVAGDVTLKE